MLLHQRGSARARLESIDPDFALPLGSLEKQVARLLHSGAADPFELHLCLEMLRLVPELDQDDAIALLHLLLVLLDNERHGNTRLGLAPPAPLGHLRRGLSALLESPTQGSIDALLHKLPEALQRCSALFAEHVDNVQPRIQKGVEQDARNTCAPMLSTTAQEDGGNSNPSYAKRPMDNNLGRPFVIDGPWLYTHRLFRAEQKLANAFVELAAALLTPSKSPQDLDTAPPKLLCPTTFALDEQQVLAIRTALLAPLCIITGGPGSGKTTVVASLLANLLDRGSAAEHIALAAPTGKAARRLQESIAQQQAHFPNTLERAWARLPAPQTLHRLLGYSPHTQRFSFDAHTRLPFKTLIVDELSMVDLDLAASLLCAISPDAQVVLIGDAQQLPSVEAGSVLRDLIDAVERLRLPNTLVQLQQTHRLRPDAQQDLLRFTEVVRNIPNTCTPVELRERFTGPHGSLYQIHKNTEEISFEGLELFVADDEQTLQALSRHWVTRLLLAQNHFQTLQQQVFALHQGRLQDRDELTLRAALTALQQQRILCASKQRGSRFSTVASNERIEIELRKQLFLGEQAIAGSPWMIRANDYHHQLFNGDTGLLFYARADDAAQDTPSQPMLLFEQADTSLACFHLDAVRAKLSLAHAITIHKSQGNEFEHVMVLLSEEAHGSNRELLYTALTRARRGVLLVASEERLLQSLCQTVIRESGVVERIRSLSRGHLGNPIIP
ncbi:MAG: exodeoxyribonuclease V subunit alpha [Myxococcota bacterium]|jgi:exodeoxyribonuclease V alpha subunit|nr:exodeoxyribonuclease V subunit alpha [Myxococcota bacterium]